MGDIADSILEGYFCEQCGEYLGDPGDESWEAAGFPQSCASCSDEE